MDTMKRKEILKYSGDECDCFSRYWRSITNWNPGVAKRVKRGYNRKIRRMWANRLKDGEID